MQNTFTDSTEDYVENSQSDSEAESHSEGAAAAHEFATHKHIILGDHVNTNCSDDSETSYTSKTSKTMSCKRRHDQKHTNNAL